MRNTVVRRALPSFPHLTLTACLLGATLSPAVLASEPILPDANISETTTQTTDNPVAQLPPAPSVQTAAGVTSAPSKTPAVLPDKTPEASAVVAKMEASSVAPQPGQSTPENSSQPKARPGESLRALAKRLNLALPLSRGRIVVTKSQRRLDLYQNDVLLKSYHVSLGSNPVGHKKQQGDGRTPEGQFYICTRNSKTSAFHIFLGLSYPALPDATRGVQKKAITPREFQIIRQRLASRGAPLWGTRLGGWVGIHGGTDDAYAQRTMKARKSRDWTAGCVALNNREIEELHLATRIGTPVLVTP